jgi:hypothetical protein
LLSLLSSLELLLQWSPSLLLAAIVLVIAVTVFACLIITLFLLSCCSSSLLLVLLSFGLWLFGRSGFFSLLLALGLLALEA